MKQVFYFLASVLTAALYAFVATAQVGTISSDIQFRVIPKYPGPYETVRIEAQSFSFDVKTTPFVWFINGRKDESGIAKTIITAKTGPIGTPLRVTVQATPRSSTRHYEQTLTIWPAHVDLLWQTNTYTPPWYRGKALPVSGALLTIIALPTLSSAEGAIEPQEAFYDWHVDNTPLSRESGMGKNTLQYRIPSNERLDKIIRVSVYNKDKTVKMEKRITIPIQQPRIIFYELDPLRGPRIQHMIGNEYAMASASETQIIAEPFFSSIPAAQLSYEWTIGNESLDPGETPRVLTYRVPSAITARQNVTLNVINPFSVFERLQKSFIIQVE